MWWCVSLLSGASDRSPAGRWCRGTFLCPLPVGSAHATSLSGTHIFTSHKLQKKPSILFRKVLLVGTCQTAPTPLVLPRTVVKSLVCFSCALVPFLLTEWHSSLYLMLPLGGTTGRMQSHCICCPTDLNEILRARCVWLSDLLLFVIFRILMDWRMEAARKWELLDPSWEDAP